MDCDYKDYDKEKKEWVDANWISLFGCICDTFDAMMIMK
jgi:hypothetical protein